MHAYDVDVTPFFELLPNTLQVCIVWAHFIPLHVLCCLSFCADGDSQESVLDEKEVIRHLFILGEVAQVGSYWNSKHACPFFLLLRSPSRANLQQLSPNNLSQHTSLMVQSLLVSNSDEASTSTGTYVSQQRACTHILYIEGMNRSCY